MVKPKTKVKRTGVKRDPKEVIEEAVMREEKSLSSSEFDYIFDVNYEGAIRKQPKNRVV